MKSQLINKSSFLNLLNIKNAHRAFLVYQNEFLYYSINWLVVRFIVSQHNIIDRAVIWQYDRD